MGMGYKGRELKKPTGRRKTKSAMKYGSVSNEWSQRWRLLQVVCHRADEMEKLELKDRKESKNYLPLPSLTLWQKSLFLESLSYFDGLCL